MKTRLISLLTALALAAGPAGPAAAQVQLPSLGDAASDDFGVGAEKRVGEQIMREIRRDPAYLDDPLLLDYVQSLWSPLLSAARQRGDIGPDTDGAFAWEVFLVRDRSINAFALPGGYVGIHLGLIGMTTQRDELASVMAHELAHVTQRHIARSIANSQRQGMVGLAAMILGILLASRAGNSDAVQAAIVGGQAAVTQGQLNYSRDMEREADRVGFGSFAAAGYVPDGMASMFEKMSNATRLYDSNSFPYLRSHPLTIERIAEARARIEAADTAPSRPRPTLFEHSLMQVRARVLVDTSVQALQRTQAQQSAPAASPAERLGTLYGNSLAALLANDPAAADVALVRARELLRTSPLREARDPRAERAIALLHAQVLMARGDAPGAITMVDGLPDASSRPATLMRAQAALQAHRSGAVRGVEELRRSTEALQTWVSEHRGDVTAWLTLAQCAGQLGLPLRAVRAEAEARAHLGDLPGAIDRLRAAQRMARTAAAGEFIEASVIDARLRELEAQRRQMLAEMRGSRAPEGDAGQ